MLCQQVQCLRHVSFIARHNLGISYERNKLQADVVTVNLCLVFQLTRHLYGSLN